VAVAGLRGTCPTQGSGNDQAELCALILCARRTVINHTRFAAVDAVVIGDQARGEQLLAPLRALGPEIDTFAIVPPAEIAELHMDPQSPVPYVADGQMLGDLEGERSTGSLRPSDPARAQSC
jgi:hypothetical protein